MDNLKLNESLNEKYRVLYNEENTIIFNICIKNFDTYEYINPKQKFMKISFINNIVTFILCNPKKGLWLYISAYILYLMKHYDINFFEDVYINYNFYPNNINKNIKVFSCGGNKNNFFEISWLSYYILNPDMAGFKNMKINDIIDKYYSNICDNKSDKLIIWRGIENSNIRTEAVKYFSKLNNVLYDVQISKPDNYIDMFDFYKAKYIIEIFGCSDGHIARRYFNLLSERVIISPQNDNYIYFFISDDYDCNIKENFHYITYNKIEDIVKIIEFIEKNQDIYNNIIHNIKLYKNNHLKFDEINKFSKKLLLSNSLKSTKKGNKTCLLCKDNIKNIDFSNFKK